MLLGYVTAVSPQVSVGFWEVGASALVRGRARGGWAGGNLGGEGRCRAGQSRGSRAEEAGAAGTLLGQGAVLGNLPDLSPLPFADSSPRAACLFCALTSALGKTAPLRCCPPRCPGRTSLPLASCMTTGGLTILAGICPPGLGGPAGTEKSWSWLLVHGGSQCLQNSSPQATPLLISPFITKEV